MINWQAVQNEIQAAIIDDVETVERANWLARFIALVIKPMIEEHIEENYEPIVRQP